MIDTREKITPAGEIASSDHRTVLVLSRFDVLRAEHCRLLEDIRKEAQRTVAVVSPDSEAGNCLLDQQSRAQLTAALAAVDQVIICDSETARTVASRLSAEMVDLEARLKRNLVADVLQRQSAGA